MKTETYDVIIVGSGLAGSLCACKLARANANLRIVILEAGDNGLDDTQRAAFQRVGSVVGPGWKSPYAKMASRPFAPYPESPDDLAKEKYYDQSQNTSNPFKGFKATYLRLTGGTTWGWRGNTPRFIASDFKLGTLYPKLGVEDWPLTYEDLEADVTEAERELGVAGDSGAWSAILGHAVNFPMPPIPLSYGDKLMQTAIHALPPVEGVKISVVSTPQARNSVPYRGRPACEGNSNCIPLCPIQAKYDATVHLQEALSLGVELRNGCVVTEVLQKDGTVTGVKGISWLTGTHKEAFALSGRVVVLAANPVETCKLLLLSRESSGNQAFTNGAIGKYIMDHVQEEAVGIFTEPVYPFRGPQSTCGIEGFRDGEWRGDRAGFRMTVGNDGWGRKETAADALHNILHDGQGPVIGAALRDKVADRITRMVRISFSIEVLPRKTNEIVLSGLPENERYDKLGVRRPEIRFALSPYEWDGLKKGYELASGMLKSIGCTLEHEEELTNFNTAAHPMGGCRMGTDAKTSVTNSDGRSHEYPNLYMAGSSVFTTASSANPTLMLTALTLRTSRAIISQLNTQPALT